MFNHDAEAEALHAIKASEALDKLEPRDEDYEARYRLCGDVSEQINRVTQKILLEIKVGIDEAHFARIKMLTDSPEEINKHLQVAKEKWDNSFWVYSDAIKEIMAKVEDLK